MLADLHGVDEAVAAADVGYFYGAVSVGAESGRHSLCSFRHFDCNGRKVAKKKFNTFTLKIQI